MSRRPRTPRISRFSAVALAGWIFADIMIVLFLVGLGSAAAPEVPKPRPKSAQAKPKPRIVGMRTRPSVQYVRYDTGALLAHSRAEQQRVCGRVRRATRHLTGRRAALVLIFGGGRDIGAAVASSTALSRRLRCARQALFGGSVRRAFWDGQLQSGVARLEVFLFVTANRKERT